MNTKKHTVIVCGGGPAGCAAAIAAARHGARTLLIEKDGYLGGAAVSQLVGVVLSTNRMDFPAVWGEWAGKLAGIGGIGDWHRTPNHRYPEILWYRNSVDPERVKHVWDALLEEAGVDILHFTTVIGSTVTDGHIAEIECFCRGDRFALRADIFIDATGNGDVAHLSGCAWHRGFSDRPWPQAVSLNRLTTGHDDRKPGEGGTLGPRPEHLGRIDRKRVDPLDPASLTEAVRAMRKEHLAQQGGRLLWTAPDLGVRTSRIVEGIDTVATEEAWNCRKRDDGIARASWDFDVHPSDDSPLHPRQLQSCSAEYAQRATHILAGDHFDIPYGAIVAKDVDNLLLAGRIVSSEILAQGSLRIQQTCMATGWAAGIAGALGVREEVFPKNLDAQNVASRCTWMQFQEM
jgi:hypothetical protein